MKSKKIKNTNATVSNLSEKKVSDDQLVWERYIENLYSQPEHSFRPQKGRDHSLRSKLDLHNMTIQQAFNRTKQFLEEHRLNGSKYAVIVSGKGGKISDELPMWCENLGFVSSCEPIRDSSGEHGAYMVRFYRNR